MSKIKLKSRDFSEVRQNALKEYINKGCPKDVGSDDFVAFCYMRAFNLLLAKNQINIELEHENENRGLTIEPIDEGN